MTWRNPFNMIRLLVQPSTNWVFEKHQKFAWTKLKTEKEPVISRQDLYNHMKVCKGCSTIILRENRQKIC